MTRQGELFCFLFSKEREKTEVMPPADNPQEARGKLQLDRGAAGVGCRGRTRLTIWQGYPFFPTYS